MGGRFLKLQNNMRSKVELSPFFAKHYETILNIVSFGAYIPFTKNVIEKAPFEKGDSVLDLGSGSGHFACLIAQKANPRRYVGIDISKEMLKIAKERCKNLKNIEFVPGKIQENLPFNSEFDKVFISFVLHGFVQEERLKIIRNAYKSLKPGGKFIILDYAEKNVDKSPLLVKFLIRKAECPLAEKFMKRNLKEMLRREGFSKFEEIFFFKGYVRLEIATKGYYESSF